MIRKALHITVGIRFHFLRLFYPNCSPVGRIILCIGKYYMTFEIRLYRKCLILNKTYGKERIMPTTYFIIFLLLSIGCHFMFPLLKFIFPPYSYLGFGLVIFGIIMNLWTDSLFKQKQTTVKPYEMPNVFVTSGPFKISRHPMYLGMMSILLGVAIFLGSLITFAFP